VLPEVVGGEHGENVREYNSNRTEEKIKTDES
jgi:hypothetical protein